MFLNLKDYFTDSVLQAPTIGCMLMCLVAALVGTFVVLRGKSLIGETLSHAAYPGVIIALLCERYFFINSEYELLVLSSVLIGAVTSCLAGVYLIELLEKSFRVPADAALSFVLSSFFGIGITVLSALQQDFPTLYKELQAYLFGQAATMRDIHVIIYACLALLVIIFILIYFREIQALLFDPIFADLIGIKRKKIEALLFCMLVLAVVIGIRSCGVVLMSAMLIFPAACARQFTNKLSTLLALAALFGIVCGYFGVVLSHEMSLFFWQGVGKVSSFPTGPMIVLLAALIFFISILFSNRGGVVLRVVRKINFSWQCQQENLLKIIWKICSKKKSPIVTYQEIEPMWHTKGLSLKITLFMLTRRGWLKKRGVMGYSLTALGMLWGRKIVRLHRLWEVYLVDYC